MIKNKLKSLTLTAIFMVSAGAQAEFYGITDEMIDNIIPETMETRCRSDVEFTFREGVHPAIIKIQLRDWKLYELGSKNEAYRACLKYREQYNKYY